MTVQPTPFFSLHTHSRYSSNDALSQVSDLVDRAVALDYPALGLTDHGNISGSVELYKSCRKRGIEPMPGIELYVNADRMHKVQGKMHLTIAAYSERGYRNLVGINNLAMQNFFYKPALDLADLAGLSDDGKLGGLLVSTGCFFGAVQRVLVEQGYDAAYQVTRSLAQWFPKCYVELHNHGVPREEGPTEDEIVEQLLSIATDLGLPFLIAADAHYTVKEDQKAHDALKELVGFSDDPSEAQFPGGPYHLPDRKFLARYFDPQVVDEACHNLADLASMSHVRLPELESFQLQVPDVTRSGDADKELYEAVVQSCAGLDKAVFDAEHQRIAEEIEVVQASGMAGYLLMVKLVCDFMREKGIWFHTRGSASGSLICYRLGITQVHPLTWGLRMDRFMSKDRTRPPDIDLDVEHERRDEVVDMLKQRFYVRPVGNYMQYGIKEEEDPNGESEGKGSLLVKYFSTQKKKGVEVHSWEEISRNDKDLLLDLASRKLISGMSKHAAGYIVAPSEASIAGLPLTYISSSKQLVTSFDKKAVEALGYCKLDLLGLKTKTAVKYACEAIHSRLVDSGDIDSFRTPMEWYEAIPQNDKATLARISRGDTEGTFQLAGFTMQRGCKDLKPRSTADVVAAVAIFRPAMTKVKLDKAIIRRRKKEEAIPERHPDIARVTKDTWGVALYQEQIITLCRDIGMTADELTDTLDAVKASNASTAGAGAFLKSIEGKVRGLAEARGWGPDDVAWLVDGLAGYAEYSFNKAHSASYGVEAYRTAYLAEHYPLEFWNGVLTAYANSSKETDHVRAARGYKVVIKPAHVNLSKASYTIAGDHIRKGLLSVKGVGPVAAAELALHAPYKSLTDLGQRVTARKVSGAKGLALKKPPAECGGVITALYEYGALDGLETE